MRANWLVLVTLILITAAAHWVVINIGSISLLGGSVRQLTLAFEHPQIAWMVGSQVFVILLAYAAMFWLILVLGTPRRIPRSKFETGAWLLVFSYIAVSWLLLRAHSICFPHSTWTWFASLVQKPLASWAVDVVSALFILWRFGELSLHQPKAVLLGSATVGLCTATLIVLDDGTRQRLTEQPSSKAPTVIVLGLDSIRRDVLNAASPEFLPNIAAIRDSGFLNSNVVTPLARTFPAWVTILTGLGPSESGARANHAPRAGIRKEQSIAWDFKRAGFRTVYGTDETRFSNISADFGFDQVIGPQMGVSDFVLSQFADVPLVNFLVRMPFAEVLLPALVGNRGFTQAYYQEDFVGRFARAIGPSRGKPHFIGIHLCTPHWPYITAKPKGGNPNLPEPQRSYQAMLMQLDDQVGLLLERLRNLGYIHDKTLIAMLSDHGEAFSTDKHHAKIRLLEDGQPRDVDGFVAGHGGTLLSPEQWEVFSVFSGWSASGEIPKGSSEKLASLGDMANTLRKLAGLADVPKTASVVPVMGPRNFVRIESGWRPSNFNFENPVASQALELASTAYDIQQDGRLEFKPEMYSNMLREREYAVTTGNETIGVISIDQRAAIVVNSGSGDGWAGQWADEADKLQVDPLLMNAACAWNDIKSRIPEWCENNVGH